MNRNAEEIVNLAVARLARDAFNPADRRARHVAILMALHNGGANLGEQLASYQAQSHADWSLIVSDDSSSDDGPAQIRAFAAACKRPVSLIAGPNRGFARNFMHLLAAAGPKVPFAALSDQDDVWLPSKLARALERLSEMPAGRPALYAGRTVVCNAALQPLRLSPRFDLPPGFGNALVQSIGGGNTMVLNRAALDLAQETARHAEGVIAHDWWLYQIVTGAGGHVFYDPEPMVLYRQHGGNLIGANDTWGASATRAIQVMRGRFRDWNSANIAALESATHWLTPEARQALAAFRRTRGGTLRKRLAAVEEAGLFRQTRRGNLALKLAAVFNRL